MPLPPTPPIVDVALYRDGTAYVVRELTIAPGTERTLRFRLPAPTADGTLWFEGSEGVSVRSLRTRLVEQPEDLVRTAETIADILSLNVGRTVKLIVLSPDGKSERALTGRLTALTNGLLTLRKADGQLRQTNVAGVVALDPRGLRRKGGATAKRPLVEQVLTVTAARAGRVRILSLESGPRWVPSYRLDLSGDATGVLQGRVQIASAGYSFRAARARAVDGGVALPRNPRIDLAIGAGGVQAYEQGRYAQLQAAEALGLPEDPFDRVARLYFEYLRRREAGVQFASGGWAYPGSAPAGGFGGGGGLGGDYRGGLTQDANRMAEAEPAQPVQERIGDAFSYPLGPLTLGPNERLTRQTFRQEAPVTRLYRFIGPVEPPQYNSNSRNLNDFPLTAVLRLQNGSGQPWTRGQVFIEREGLPLAQSDLPFTSPGRDADVVIGTAEDLRGKVTVTVVRSEQRIGRVGTVEYTYTFNRYRLTLQVTNSRAQTVRLDLRPWIQGTIVNPGPFTPGPLVVLPDGTRIEATLDTTLSPGETKTYELEYERRA